MKRKELEQLVSEAALPVLWERPPLPSPPRALELTISSDTATQKAAFQNATVIFCAEPKKTFQNRLKTLGVKPNKICYITPKLIKKLKKKNQTEAFVLDMVRLGVLQKNAPYGWLFWSAKWGLPFVLLACAALFLVPTPLVPQVSHFRDLAPEIHKYSGTPSFVFTLPDSAYFFQASRYALGRYTATVATREEVYAYQAETLAKNPGLASPPKTGDEIRYYRPEHLGEADPVDATAWRFWTGIFNDSVAYITEAYHERESKTQRKHLGIDIATPRGSRILAPFSGEAWIQKGERSGQSIALVGKETVLVFMHCDQVFYLDGQAVVAGDPIATVGMTGHTTGPHVHVQAGVPNPKGEHKIGALRYDIMSPFAWYFQFSRFSK